MRSYEISNFDEKFLVSVVSAILEYCGRGNWTFKKCGNSFTNFVFSIKNPWSSEVLFLKIFNPKFPPQHFLSEIKALATAKQIGINVPDVVEYDYYTVQEVKISYMINRALPGIPLIDVPASITKSVIEQIFKIIKKLHVIKQKQFGSITTDDNSYIPRSNYYFFIADIFEFAYKKWVNNRSSKIARDIYKLHGELGPKLCAQINCFVFSHKDLNLKHLFILKDKSLAVIDWEWSLYLDFCYDYAVFITSILIDAGSEELFIYSLDRSKSFFSEQQQRLLYFHIGRELFFSTIFTHRRRKLSKKEIESRLERSKNFFELAKK